MVLERRAQIAQHGVIFGGKRNKIDRGGGRTLLAPVQVIETYAHMQG